MHVMPSQITFRRRLWGFASSPRAISPAVSAWRSIARSTRSPIVGTWTSDMCTATLPRRGTGADAVQLDTIALESARTVPLPTVPRRSARKAEVRGRRGDKLERMRAEAFDGDEQRDGADDDV